VRIRRGKNGINNIGESASEIREGRALSPEKMEILQTDGDEATRNGTQGEGMDLGALAEISQNGGEK
jgi:hypothetical protein